MTKTHISTTINGEPTEYLREAHHTMLDVLRGLLGLTGAKEGCASGDCGACSIILDDRLVCSCLMLGVEAEGREISTIEGMAQGERLRLCSRNSSSTRRASVRHLHARRADRRRRAP